MLFANILELIVSQPNPSYFSHYVYGMGHLSCKGSSVRYTTYILTLLILCFLEGQKCSVHIIVYLHCLARAAVFLISKIIKFLFTLSSKGSSVPN